MNKQTNTSLINILTLFLLILLSVSCNVTEECFSCDSTLNAWAKTNKSQFLKLNREEIASYSPDRQKVILATLPPERKKMLWQEKIDYILTLDLPKEEINYLKWYADIFNSIDYSKPALELIEKELYNRTIEGMKKFDWSHKFVYQTFFVLGNVDSKEINHNNRFIEPEGVACDCIHDIGCTWGTMEWCDNSVKCNQETTEHDCGVLGYSECTGKCSDGI